MARQADISYLLLFLSGSFYPFAVGYFGDLVTQALLASTLDPFIFFFIKGKGSKNLARQRAWYTVHYARHKSGGGAEGDIPAEHPSVLYGGNWMKSQVGRRRPS